MMHRDSAVEGGSPRHEKSVTWDEISYEIVRLYAYRYKHTAAPVSSELKF